MFQLPAEPFQRTLSKVVTRQLDRLHLTTADLARHLGVHHRTFQYWMEEEADPPRHCPAEVVPELCNKLGDHRLLDVLENHARRVAFPLPEVPGQANLEAEHIRAVAALVKEVGDALQSLGETLADGIVEAKELHSTSQELDDVIRECAKLKHWLERQYKLGQRPRRP